MLPQHRIDEVERLLIEGHSQRAVARMTGISRGTVDAVANGRRPNYASQKAKRAEAEYNVFDPEVVCRCPTCGHMVVQPCLACRLRATNGRKHHFDGVSEGSMDYDLSRLDPGAPERLAKCLAEKLLQKSTTNPPLTYHAATEYRMSWRGNTVLFELR